MDKEKKVKNKKQKWQPKSWVIVIAIIICVIVGIFLIKDSFKKFNLAAKYSEKILNLYTNSQKK